MQAFIAVVGTGWHHALLARTFLAYATIPWRQRDIAATAALLISGLVIVKSGTDNRVIAVATCVGYGDGGPEASYVAVRDLAFVPSRLAYVLPAEFDDVAINPQLDAELHAIALWYSRRRRRRGLDWWPARPHHSR